MSKYKGINFLDKCGNKITGRSKVDGQPINFRGADLRGSSFEGMTIQGVDFSGAKLQGTNFKFAKLLNATLDDTKTGITTVVRIFLEILSYILAFVSGLTAAYSLDYLFLIIQINFTPESLNNLAIAIFYLTVLLISILWAVVRGMGTYLLGFLLLNVILSFLIQAFGGNDLAATSLLGLLCFIGGLSSVFVQSQAIYLSKELQSLSETGSDSGIKIYSLYTVAVVGSIVGALSAGNSDILSAISSVLLIVSGHQLGWHARKEKQNLTQATREDFFEYLDERESDNLLESGKLIERVKEERTKRLHAKLYPAVRIIFDSVLNGYKTSFWKATFQSVSLQRTDLEKTHFVPKEILSSNPKDINEVQQNEKFIEAVAASGGNTILYQPVFGGGFAGKDGFQVGGNVSPPAPRLKE